MAELLEKQWELDGVVFGLDAPVHVEADGWTPGAAALANQDSQLPAADSVRMGKDFYGGATWGFTMFTIAEREAEAWEAINALHEVWPRDVVRLTSGMVVPLRYLVAGQLKRVYGRPRRFTVTPNNLSLGGMINVQADFATVDHRVYDDDESSTTVTLGGQLDTTQGIIPPFIPPYVGSRGSTQRKTTIQVGGTVPTPVVLTISGPIDNAKVVLQHVVDDPDDPQDGETVTLWTAALRDPVAEANPVTLDARPWARSVTKAQGGGAAVNPRITRVSQMMLPPGQHEIVFTGSDATGSATATVAWRNATRTPR